METKRDRKLWMINILMILFAKFICIHKCFKLVFHFIRSLITSNFWNEPQIITKMIFNDVYGSPSICIYFVYCAFAYFLLDIDHFCIIFLVSHVSKCGKQFIVSRKTLVRFRTQDITKPLSSHILQHSPYKINQ